MVDSNKMYLYQRKISVIDLQNILLKKEKNVLTSNYLFKPSFVALNKYFINFIKTSIKLN